MYLILSFLVHHVTYLSVSSLTSPPPTQKFNSMFKQIGPLCFSVLGTCALCGLTIFVCVLNSSSLFTSKLIKIHNVVVFTESVCIILQLKKIIQQAVITLNVKEMKLRCYVTLIIILQNLCFQIKIFLK